MKLYMINPMWTNFKLWESLNPLSTFKELCHNVIKFKLFSVLYSNVAEEINF